MPALNEPKRPRKCREFAPKGPYQGPVQVFALVKSLALIRRELRNLNYYPWSRLSF
jgi:hypothetical protein